jgi:hypothetical protein
MVDVTTPAKPVELTNCTAPAITITEAHLEGPDAREFAIVAQPAASSTVDSKQGVEYLLVMSSRSVGPKSATLVITADGGPYHVDIRGTAVGADTGTRRETYYACSSGRPVDLWFIAVPLVLIRRRRLIRV